VDELFKGIIQTEMFSKLDEETEENQKKAMEILLPPIVSLFHSTVRYFALTGRKVIVDSLIESKYWMEECLKLMSDLNVIFVGVLCPLEELERRELERGNRPTGLAKSQFSTVHSHGDYDLTINTYELSIHECATEVLTFINSNKVGSAFKNINRKFESEIIEGVSIR
jgi:chloramphenicol 3-O phosphotransferase